MVYKMGQDSFSRKEASPYKYHQSEQHQFAAAAGAAGIVVCREYEELARAESAGRRSRRAGGRQAMNRRKILTESR